MNRSTKYMTTVVLTQTRPTYWLIKKLADRKTALLSHRESECCSRVTSAAQTGHVTAILITESYISPVRVERGSFIIKKSYR